MNDRAIIPSCDIATALRDKRWQPFCREVRLASRERLVDFETETTWHHVAQDGLRGVADFAEGTLQARLSRRGESVL